MADLAAARELDEIAHTASQGWMIAGLVGGAIIGAAIIAVTGGTAAVAVAAVAAGASAGGRLGEVLGSMSWAPRHVTGVLVDGSPNVYINGRAAIRAHLSFGECAEDGPAKKVVAQGSAKVYINDLPAARINDLLACSAEIHSGSPNVIIGGDTEQTDEIEPEIPAWVNWTLLAVGAGAAAVLASPAIAILGTLGGLGGGFAGSLLGGARFGEGSDGQKWSMLAGGFAGGFLGGKGGAKFDAFNRTKAISARRAYLNEKFGRTGDLNKDITIRGNKESARDFLESKGFTSQQIKDFDNGIDYTQRVSVETLNRNKVLYQNQVPNGRQGNWYALSEKVEPTELGINPKGTIYGTDKIVDKVAMPYVTQEKVQVLRSTSLPALDTWSVKDVPFQTKGGAIQLLSSEKDLFKVKP
ncbi:polymorphic toxin type 46 domain-containing protein [Serratia odorifera]|uniref:polymorphic toxin type 46 domain-containing protein n=1 Tax=Serratia odorifera TaxID=618 RepID=UPI003D295ED6